MSVVPNGRIERDHEGHPTLVIVREFAAPIEDVWAAVTEPARLGRWIGTFTGDPASGSVMFAMTAEGDAPAEEMEIVECEPPRLLAVTASAPGGQWHLRVALSETEGRTVLTFTQPRIDPVEAESVGPGGSSTSTGSSRQRPAETLPRSTSSATIPGDGRALPGSSRLGVLDRLWSSAAAPTPGG